MGTPTTTPTPESDAGDRPGVITPADSGAFAQAVEDLALRVLVSSPGLTPESCYKRAHRMLELLEEAKAVPRFRATMTGYVARPPEGIPRPIELDALIEALALELLATPPMDVYTPPDRVQNATARLAAILDKFAVKILELERHS